MLAASRLARVAPRIRIGVIGWNYPEWRGSVYDEKAKPAEFLAQYAQRFPIVEAASAFYGMPKTASVARWASDTPEGFQVALKIPEWILKKKTHDPDLPRALDVLLEHLAPLRDAGKLAALVAQFPPSYGFGRRADDLRAFLAALPPGSPWAIELRHASWWRPETYRMLEDAGATLAWSALAEGFRTPPVVTSHALYLRLFGDRELAPPFGRKRRDARSELAIWAERIEAAAPQVERIDVLVSKYLEGYAPGTADALAEMLGVPLLPADAAPRSRQTRLA